MKIAYFGYDILVDCLKALYDNGNEIVKVFSVETDDEYEFNREIISFAKNHNIPYTLKKVTDRDLQELEKSGCHFVVCAGYFYRIPIEKVMLNSVNIHPSLLPIGRGPWPMPVTLLKGLRESGVTLHTISEGFDEGDILMREKYFLAEDENLETMVEKIQKISAIMVTECVRNYDRYITNACKQGEGEYWKEPTENEMTFTPYMTIETIDRIIRAFWGYGSIFKIADKAIKVKKATCRRVEHSLELGSLTQTGEYAILNGLIKIYK